MRTHLIRLMRIGLGLKPLIPLGLFLGTLFVGYSAFAWTSPYGYPPTNNVVAPINVSSSAQNKAGNLYIGSSSGSSAFPLRVVGTGIDTSNLSVDGASVLSGNVSIAGNVGIGTTSPDNLLQVAGLINFDDINFNTSVGRSAGIANTTGIYNSAFGVDALANNTTGGNNSAFGNYALNYNTTGGNNSAFGFGALYFNTTGIYNSAFGGNALDYNTTGSNNVALGYYSGYTSNNFNANKTGSNNTFLGYSSGPGTSTQLNNATAIGNAATVSCPNCLVLGSINGVNGATSNVNVGIGTANPSNTLTVVGSICANNSTAACARSTGSIRILIILF